MSDLASYLAANYLAADPPKAKKSKKRKRKQAEGLLITDDDETGWGSKADTADDENGGDLVPVTASGTTADFRRKQTSNWRTLDGPAAKAPAADSDAAAADAILASAAAENSAAATADDEAPIIGGDMDLDSDDGAEKMGDGTLAGLQSGASVSAQIKKQRRREREAWEREQRAKGGTKEEQAYRDATGRRVDISLRRAEARRAAAEAEDAEKKAKDALKGDVQLEEARRRREQLDGMRNMAFARTADDEEMNQELKERERWNDPMAQFLSEKKAEGTGKSGARRVKGRPIYTGPAPPNRYGIRPGFRWDGVDRGNGFETERFKALNRKERNKGLEYAWQLDD